MIDLGHAVVFLALGSLVCLSSEVEIKVYDEHEFLISLPRLKSVTTLSIRPTEENLEEDIAGESRFIVNGDGVHAWGSKYHLIRGSEINYTIQYVDSGGHQEVSGTYTFNGDYVQKPNTDDDTNRESRNALSKDEEEADEDEDEDETVDGPVVESRFGFLGGRRHRGRHHRPSLRRPPPFGFPHGPGMPPYPYMGGPDRFSPPHRRPFHHNEDDFGGGSHRGGHGHCDYDSHEPEDRHPHGGRPDRRPDPSPYPTRPSRRPTHKPTVETTTLYTPDIDIRFQDD